MIYVKNLPLWERFARIGLGMSAIAYGVHDFGSVLGWTTLAAGVGTALTGVFGFCPACAMAGRRLK